MPINIERFSPYFERPDEFGIEIAPAPHYRLLYPAARELLHDLAYSFEHRYRDGRDPAAYARPLEQAIAEWQRLAPKAAGSLWYRRGPGFLTVWDRRPGFESADYLFEGVEAKLYLGCDGGATPKDLCAQLVAAGEEERDVDEIEGYLQDLVEARLMYREGNRFLSLATAAGVGPMLLEQPAAEAAPIPALVTLRQPA